MEGDIEEYDVDGMAEAVAGAGLDDDGKVEDVDDDEAPATAAESA